LTDSQLEELRYDVAHALLKQMSKGSQFQYALDKMIELIQHATEEELCEMAPSEVVIQKKPKDKKRKGF
tara:strand:+ start:1471 stop:1677 length:207 start_codon:yes stop_codon:yes gene_type:complete